MRARPDGTEPLIAHGSVYLRAAEREDIPRFVAWLNDYRTSRTLALSAPLSIPMEEAWFEGIVAEQGNGRYLFTACLIADDRPIGNVSLFDLDHVNGNAGVGIMIGDAADRGRGHGTDMLEALLRFGFASLRLERIWLDVFDFNPRARLVYERIGFQHEGVLRHAIFREGRFVDLRRMSILSGEWRQRHPTVQRDSDVAVEAGPLDPDQPAAGP
jgi:RimJ/RimL family protein N-acetyltransferase